MAIEDLAMLIAQGLPTEVSVDDIANKTEIEIKSLFGTRYHSRSAYTFRNPISAGDNNISFAGLLREDSPQSGVYGGMSLIWFPITGDIGRPSSSLLTFVVGTRGLAPDEQILGRPGHARHLKALRRHLARKFKINMWTKQDPSDISQPFPDIIREQLSHYKTIIAKYGNFIYAAVEVPQQEEMAIAVVKAFVDVYAWERGWCPLKKAELEIAELKNGLRANVFPKVSEEDVWCLLKQRRFVILQGPPGTGKTRMAIHILKNRFKGQGMPVQFHPAVTYETFISGISPDVDDNQLRFKVRSGYLANAITHAHNTDFLLMIDEINRADLGRVLGEAIYLFEARDIAQGAARKVELSHPMADGTTSLIIPEGLYLIGTMNSADRSIAILDLAVRRRFAFVDIWPDMAVIEENGNKLAIEAFGRLQDIFAQYAPQDAMVLMPGHAYFLADSDQELANRMRYELIPLISEYLTEGRLGQCENELYAYLDWLEGAIDQFD